MSLQLPEGLMQALAAGAHGGAQASPPAGLRDSYDNDSSQDPLAVLQDCIQHLHFQVIPALTDPGMTNQAVQALKILTGIQDQLSRANSGPQTAG